jgi:hypothetical protein
MFSEDKEGGNEMGCSGMSKTTKIDPEDGKLRPKTAEEVLGKKKKDEGKEKEGLLGKLKPKKDHKTGW